MTRPSSLDTTRALCAEALVPRAHQRRGAEADQERARVTASEKDHPEIDRVERRVTTTADDPALAPRARRRGKVRAGSPRSPTHGRFERAASATGPRVSRAGASRKRIDAGVEIPQRSQLPPQLRRPARLAAQSPRQPSCRRPVPAVAAQRRRRRSRPSPPRTPTARAGRSARRRTGAIARSAVSQTRRRLAAPSMPLNRDDRGLARVGATAFAVWTGSPATSSRSSTIWNAARVLGVRGSAPIAPRAPAVTAPQVAAANEQRAGLSAVEIRSGLETDLLVLGLQISACPPINPAGPTASDSIADIRAAAAGSYARASAP